MSTLLGKLDELIPAVLLYPELGSLIVFPSSLTNVADYVQWKEDLCRELADRSIPTVLSDTELTLMYHTLKYLNHVKENVIENPGFQCPDHSEMPLPQLAQQIGVDTWELTGWLHERCHNWFNPSN